MSEPADISVTALSIAGFDPSGGAGVIADARAMASVGIFPVSVITALTLQNTAEVTSVKKVDDVTVAGQLDTLFKDIRPAASKTGMLPTIKHVEIVAERSHLLGRLIVDPVFRSTSGAQLADEEAVEAIISKLIPACDLVTPNLAEAERITGLTIRTQDDARQAARSIHAMGAQAVCVTGGHWSGDPIDLLYDGDSFRVLSSSVGRIHGEFHGTGCFFSASATAHLALGMDVLAAVQDARQHTLSAIANAVHPGKGMSVPWPPLA
jgi:hydroxymethylpyrimidine/phosphomethylpyrimidine kinase